MPPRLERTRVLYKTADYTINPAVDRPGTLFTNRGALGAVTFTLPTPNVAQRGDWYEFLVHANQTIVVAGATAGDLATLDNAAADTISLATTNAKIGRGLVAVCDGTQWHCYPSGSLNGVSVNGAPVSVDVVGVAAGYKVARGMTALDGANPTPVAHGLTTCVAFIATLKGTAAPGLGTSVLTANINGANTDVYAWKPTSAIDATLIASTGVETFYWVAIGT